MFNRYMLNAYTMLISYIIYFQYILIYNRPSPVPLILKLIFCLYMNQYLPCPNIFTEKNISKINLLMGHARSWYIISHYTFIHNT